MNRQSPRSNDLTGAIELLGEGKFLVLADGFITTDGGHQILSQYIDIGANKQLSQPTVLVKAIESEYGLEYASDILLSVPRRFRNYGETLIRDKQEGYADRENKTETSQKAPEDSNREKERALELLGVEGATISSTGKKLVEASTESVSFGENALIYCTSIKPPESQRAEWRASLPEEYDHESIIRQRRRFALALGEMFVDQYRIEREQGKFTHNSGIQSFHAAQSVWHGPVWYTDDVLGFLESRQPDPLAFLYAIFVKDIKYQAQREYRFVIHLKTPIDEDTVSLSISGNLRSALVPPRNIEPVVFQRHSEVSNTDSPSEPVVTQTQSNIMTQTHRMNKRNTHTTSIGGDVVAEEVSHMERVISIKTKIPVGVSPEILQNMKLERHAAVAERSQSEIKIEGKVVDRLDYFRTKVIHIEDSATALEGCLTPDEQEDREKAEAILDAVAHPFEKGLYNLPEPQVEALKMLSRISSSLDRNVEIQVMSACWNSIWAICNLYEHYGDIIESVDMEGDEFVAITLKGSDDAGTEGKILVGPRGTFAYLLSCGEDKRYGHGGEESKIIFFPNKEVQDKFEEFGWKIQSSQDSEAQ